MKRHVYTAIVTPLLENGDIDLISFKRLLKYQESAGNGIVVLGSTGEALNLTLQEKKIILDATKAEKLSVPILIGVGGHNLTETLDLLKLLEEYPFNGYLLVTPIYAKPGLMGQTLWFETLMNAVTKPCMLYNVPGRSAVALIPEVLKTLREHPRFWALKEASGSIEKFAQFKEVIPHHAIYSGDDSMLPFYAPLGVAGVVSVASNVWAFETKRYAELCIKKDFSTLFPLWTKACDALFTASNPVPVKALLHHKGLITTPQLKAPLHHEDFHQLEKLHSLDLKITQWMRENT